MKRMIVSVIETCNKRGKYVGICGQAPSDYPDFAEFLVKHEIQSISLNPDSILETVLYLAEHEDAREK